MARLTVIGLCVLVVSWSTPATTGGLALEEQLEQLKGNVKELTSKVTQLETELHLRNQQYDILATQMVKALGKLEQHESFLNILKKEQQNVEHGPITRTQNENQVAGKNSAITRTCRELKLADPSLSSGMYWVDPDGQNIGDDPINVYCDMDLGVTSILHDSESPINVGHCLDPGCYSRIIKYQASSKQMDALIALSSECKQSIKYECSYAPLQFDGVQYSWWNDRNGNPRYYWAGSNDSGHTCQCGIDKNCIESTMTCNCDSTLPLPTSDQGYITNKNQLPISRLNFGRTQLSTSNGVHTLGRLECKGFKAISSIPTSCEDLWHIGYTLSGLYLVNRNGQIESNYCDFTKLPSHSSFQISMGYVPLKTSPITFYVQKQHSHYDGRIPYDIVILNLGEAMDPGSGIFTAPKAGVYSFSFSGVSYMGGTTTDGYYKVALVHNGYYIGQGRGHFTQGKNYQTLSLQSVLKLNIGDQVWLENAGMGNADEVRLIEDGSHYTHFTGVLLHEDF